MSQTILSVQQRWLQTTGEIPADNPPLTCDDFVAASSFGDSLREIIELFPGVARPPKEDVAGALRDMARSGGTDMPYYKLRALAKYLELRPVGLLLLFAQLVGIERDAKKKNTDARAECRRLVAAVSRVMDALEEYLKAKQAGDDLFYHRYDRTDAGYLPDLKVLKMCRDALNRKS